MSPCAQTPSTAGPPIPQKFGAGLAGGTSVAPFPRSLIPSVVISTFSAYVPRCTMMVVPGAAASTAAWIDWPGWTTTVPAAPAGLANTTPNALAQVATRTARKRLVMCSAFPPDEAPSRSVRPVPQADNRAGTTVV